MTSTVILIPADLAPEVNEILEESYGEPENFAVAAFHEGDEHMIVLRSLGPAAYYTDPPEPSGGWSMGAARAAEVLGAMIVSEEATAEPIPHVRSVSQEFSVTPAPLLPDLPPQAQRRNGAFYMQDGQPVRALPGNAVGQVNRPTTRKGPPNG